MRLNPSACRTMEGPRKAADYLRENFSRAEQVAELESMLKEPATTNLAHGIAIELRLAEDEALKGAMVESLKMTGDQMGLSKYGALQNRDVGKPSEFAGKGPLFAQLKNAD